MKNNYEENKKDEKIQNSQTKENNFSDKEYYNTGNNFFNKEEIDKKYNYYLSTFNKEKNNTNSSFVTKKNEQIEKLLEEEKNIEDENIQRLKELRNKYLSSAKFLDEEKDLHNYFIKNNNNETEENKLWKICYSNKDILNNNSRNSLDNLAPTQNQYNTSNNTNNDIINNNLEINMSIYERKNPNSQNQSYNTYKCNDSEFNKSEDCIKKSKYSNLLQNQNNAIFSDNQNLESDYNKLLNDYNLLKKEYSILEQKYNLENNNNEKIINKNNSYNDYIIKEIEELKNINSNYEYVLTPLINYINDIDYIIDKTNLKKIDITKLKKNIKNLFPKKNITNRKEHPLFPFHKLLQNYKDIIYNNEKIQNLYQQNKINKNSKKKVDAYESLLNSYNIKNINNMKFKSFNATNKMSRSIVATPNISKNDKIKKIFSNRKNHRFLEKNKINSINKNSINTSTHKENSKKDF